MGAMTNYYENKLLDAIFRGQSITFPANLYVALFSTPTTEDGGGDEIIGGGYQRVPVSRSLEAWSGTQDPLSTDISNGTSGKTYNIIPIQFPEATDNWGVITHFGIFETASGGNMLFYGELGVPRSVYAGDSPTTFLPGDMYYQIDN